MLYIVIGVLVLRAGRAEDPNGVLEYVGQGNWGWLLFAMAAGFLGYGLWRLADAALAVDSGGEDREWVKRLAAMFSGGVYLYLAKQSLDVALHSASLAENEPRQYARELLQIPGGELLLGLGAIVLMAAGAFQLVMASNCAFLDKLDESVRGSWVKWLGRAGYAARGAVFLVVGGFLAAAALSSRASSAGGVEQALEWLSSPIDMIVAGGLMLFGLYALLESRYRRIHTPSAHEIGREMRNAVQP